MNYPALRYVASKDCTVKGPARAVLWVIAYHSDRDTGECWVGQRRLAEESGFARSTVQRALDELYELGVLEWIEGRQGPKPERYQIAPHLVEGSASTRSVVEGQATAAGVVEGEVIHSPSASGLPPGPLAGTPNFLLDRSGWPSGPIGSPAGELVDRSADSSGLLLTRSPAETTPKVLDQGSLTSRENHVVGDADASVVADAMEPPPVPDSLLRELDRRGLRKPTGDPRPRSTDPPTRSREEQLRELERIIAEDEAKSAKSAEGDTATA